MTKKEYLDQLKKDTGHKASDPNYRMKILLKKVGMILAAALILTGAAVAATSYSRSSEYDAGGLPTWDNLGYKDSFSRLNQPPIGNDINNLMSGGKILIWDKNKALGMASNRQDFTQLGAVSYINRVESSYVYRDDKTLRIYAYNPANNERNELFSGRAGEVFCVGSTVYFINLEAGRNIYSIDLNVLGYSNPVVEANVISFGVCNDAIVYLTADNKLCSWDINGKHESPLASNIDQFFINGNIIAKSGNKILSFTTKGELPKELYISEGDNLSLVGVHEDTIYLQENGKLLAYKNGDVQEVVADTHDMYRSIAYDGNSDTVHVEALDNSGGKIIETLLALGKE